MVFCQGLAWQISEAQINPTCSFVAFFGASDILHASEASEKRDHVRCYLSPDIACFPVGEFDRSYWVSM